jgi:DNA-directed RNA polymerase specialized sigma24 family protein
MAMETFYIPSEHDFKKWIKEAVKECLEESLTKAKPLNSIEGELMSRKEIANKLKISLVTLNSWVNRGLPSYKQRGRVYFIYSEVMEHIKKNDFRRQFQYS